MSPDQEDQIGLQLKTDLDTKQGVVCLTDPMTVAYVRAGANNVIQFGRKERPEVTWQVFVIDDSQTVNAFRAPPGRRRTRRRRPKLARLQSSTKNGRLMNPRSVPVSRRWAWLAPSIGTLAAAAIPFATSCAGFNLPDLQLPAAAEQLSPPQVTFVGATMVGAPPARTLAAYYCPDVVSAPLGTGPMICQGLFGPRPNPAALAVTFDIQLHIANPNHVPIPLASVLAAATVFPAATNEKLGAICLSLCPAGTPGCTGIPAPGACEASARDVRSLNDFVNRSLPQLLIAGGLAMANGQPPSFVAPPLNGSSQIDVVARYSFGPEQLLGVLRQLAVQSMSELRAGRAPTFTIPYRLEGTIWFDAGSIGRIAVGWGPTQGTWVLPVEGLIPRY